MDRTGLTIWSWSCLALSVITLTTAILFALENTRLKIDINGLELSNERLGNKYNICLIEKEAVNQLGMAKEEACLRGCRMTIDTLLQYNKKDLK